MAEIQTELVGVGTTPTLLFDSAGASGGPGDVSDSSVGVLNDGGTTVYVGGADVTTADGFPVTVGGPPFTMSRMAAGHDLYGVVAAGSENVRVIRQV